MAGVKGKPNCAADFSKSLARAGFFGVPHQNDGGRGCHAAPNSVHSAMILWRRQTATLFK
jgi:hypothetical protein